MKKLLTLILALMLHATAQAQVLPDDHWIFTHQWYGDTANKECVPVISNPKKVINNYPSVRYYYLSFTENRRIPLINFEKSSGLLAMSNGGVAYTMMFWHYSKESCDAHMERQRKNRPIWKNGVLKSGN